MSNKREANILLKFLYSDCYSPVGFLWANAKNTSSKNFTIAISMYQVVFVDFLGTK